MLPSPTPVQWLCMAGVLGFGCQIAVNRMVIESESANTLTSPYKSPTAASSASSRERRESTEPLYAFMRQAAPGRPYPEGYNYRRTWRRSSGRSSSGAHSLRR